MRNSRRALPGHDWFLDEPVLWFFIWLGCIAAWVLLTILHQSTGTWVNILNGSPTLVSAFALPMWFPRFADWLVTWWRFRRLTHG